jgi:hypothetical protein
VQPLRGTDLKMEGGDHSMAKKKAAKKKK